MTHKCVTIPINAIEQYVRGVLFNLLYKVFLTSKSVNETLVCDHLNESYWTVISCGTVYYALSSSTFFLSSIPRLWFKVLYTCYIVQGGST